MGWSTKSTQTSNGTKQIWKLWRHCCCRYGWYPLVVAPLVTAGCLLDLYSTFDCRFIQVNVGFLPSNEAWNKTTADLGLFYFRTTEEETNKYRRVLVEGCRDYSDDFEAYFIAGDRTWEVARIMTVVSGIAAAVAMVTIWIIVFTPIPACFCWPGVLLPALMVAFLAGGSKFLFFDTAICHSALWSPSGSESSRRVAQSCQLGRTGYAAIAAGATFFIALLLVCLKAPKKRELQDDFAEFDEGDLMSVESHLDIENDMDGIRTITVKHTVNPAVRKNTRVSPDCSKKDEPEHSYSGNFEMKSAYNSFDFNREDSFSSADQKQDDSFEGDLGKDPSHGTKAFERRDDELISKPSSNDSDERYPGKQAPAPNELPPRPEKLGTIQTNTKISQTRLTKAELLQSTHRRKASDELIDKVVQDLEKSFHNPNMSVEGTLASDGTYSPGKA